MLCNITIHRFGIPWFFVSLFVNVQKSSVRLHVKKSHKPHVYAECETFGLCTIFTLTFQSYKTSNTLYKTVQLSILHLRKSILSNHLFSLSGINPVQSFSLPEINPVPSFFACGNISLPASPPAPRRRSVLDTPPTGTSREWHPSRISGNRRYRPAERDSWPAGRW